MENTPEPVFRLATPADAEPLADMINTAFRADTTTQVFLSPNHASTTITTPALLTEKILAEDTVCILLVSPNASNPSTPSTILAHGGVRKLGSSTAWFGMLAVRTGFQKRGLGDRVLREAEEYAVREWGVSRMEFNVVNTRTDLQEWYRKRGYSETGKRTPFPYEFHGEWEGVLREGLEFLDFGRELGG